MVNAEYEVAGKGRERERERERELHCAPLKQSMHIKAIIAVETAIKMQLLSDSLL